MSAASCCEASPVTTTDERGQVVFGADLYTADIAEGAAAASLGCRIPTAVAGLYPGEIVFDLGSGTGADV